MRLRGGEPTGEWEEEAKAKCQISEREDERRRRRLIAEREVRRRGDGTGCQVTRSREEKRVRGGGSTGSPSSQPSPPGVAPRSYITRGADGGGQLVGRGGVGWGRNQRPQRPRPCWACSTPGIRDSPSARSSRPLGPGVWAWKEIRILPGEWMASRQPPQ